MFSKGAWGRAWNASHPTTLISISTCDATHKKATTDGVADSGAMYDVWSLQEYLNAGYSERDLHPVSLSLKAANTSPIHINGAFFGEVSGTSVDGSLIMTKVMIYVSRDVKGFYISETTMFNLGMLPKNFPTPGCALSSHIAASTGDEIDQEEDTPPRHPLPPRLASLPFPCTQENIPKMKDFLLDYYKFSVFNNQSEDPLPEMAGPPLEIHIEETATPFVCHKPTPVPIHWDEQFHQDLIKDVKKDVLEMVPHGEPVTHCHKVVLKRKPDGSFRRTVDYSPLNRHCTRETHSMEAPVIVARRVPRKTWKTVTDAADGYHSIPLRESDRHLTTFITTHGRFRYKRAPQGFLSSGDGFNRRFDEILADFVRKERLTDDTLHYDTDLEQHWWRTIELLDTVGRSGIVLNPKKFQFCQREVDFVGFRITEERIDPHPKYFSAIRDFPTPQNATDIKSWFGLVNQVATFSQLRDIMAPFRPFLSPKNPFQWSTELDIAFNIAKDAIIAAIRKGVEIFDPQRPTCLRPDWSKKGIGYFLFQKHCECTSHLPNCCEDGWRITLAGSRFLQSAEERYAPIEGEGLAVAWGLEQTRFFTQGCDNLLVVTDHKPLVKIFGDRRLDEIHNTRLFRLKQRTLPWRFHVAHLPGSSNSAADAVSRYPSPTGGLNLLGVNDHMEAAILAALKSLTHDGMSLSWETIAYETKLDNSMRLLLEYIHHGFPTECPQDNLIRSFWRYRDSLYESDGVILYDDRAVIPLNLRKQVLNHFHSAHQGVSSMELRARTLVFWPGMTTDFDKIRAACEECCANAPSQPKLPPAPFNPPSTPFEEIVADFFKYAGYHYLIVADRLSGWPDIFKCAPGSPQSGAEGLIGCLRSYFSRFGIPSEMASDGGPEFVASITTEFLHRWGVSHRKSSAYLSQSNGRAEVAVKTAKRLLRSNIGPNGSLNTDKFLRAMLQLRNTPDPDCHLSPAQILFGRPLRDAFTFATRLEKFSNHNIRPLWRDAWRAKEDALRQRYHRTTESLKEHSRPLPPLNTGDRCYIQNQSGNHPKRWNRSGTVIETLDHDSYLIKVDGSGRVTKRNRRYLRRFTPPSAIIQQPTRAFIPLTHPVTTHDTTCQPHNNRNPSTVQQDQHDNLDDVSLQEQPTDHQESVPVVQADDLSDPLPHIEPTEAEASLPISISRHRRSARKPPVYEPETGKWVEQS